MTQLSPMVGVLTENRSHIHDEANFIFQRKLNADRTAHKFTSHQNSFLNIGLIIFTSCENVFWKHIFTSICQRTWCVHQIYQWSVCGQSQLGEWWKSCFWGQLAPIRPHYLLPLYQQHLPPHLAGTLARWAWELLLKKRERENTLEVKCFKYFKRPWSEEN